MRSAVAAPFAVAGRELREVASRPGPFVGGLLGTLASCAALTAALLWMPSPASAEPEDSFVVEFIPASVISAGELDGEAPSPEAALDQPSEDTEPASDEPGAAVSEDASTPTTPEPGATPEPTPTPTPTPQPQPTPTVDPAPNPSPLPPPGQDVDNPFGERVWSELVAAGDPWAAAIMKALRSMKVPAWAGQISADNPYRFRLRICKDGRVDKVLRKASTGDQNLDATLAHEIERLDLPSVPGAIARQMSRSCMVLDYDFGWYPGGVR